MAKIPASHQNPLLSSGKFSDHCKPRFRGLSLHFPANLESYRADGTLLPIFATDDDAYYSTFQTWQVWKLLTSTPRTEYGFQRLAQFNDILALLVLLQDFYMPEIRGNCRSGEYRDYHGAAGIRGTNFLVTRTIPIGVIRRWRQECLTKGIFDPAACLAGSRLTVDVIIRWIERLWRDAEAIDPLERWQLAMRYIKYNRKSQLRYDALLAQDFRETAEVLALFLNELGDKSRILTEVLLPGRAPASSVATADWMVNLYGPTALDNPFEMLEYVANDLGLNPQPRAVILTEGEEWRALSRLFEFYGLDPKLVGIEFRSLQGEGNFSLANWQCFVEYMHEKQVFVYFVLDREGRAAREARRMLKAKRKFRCEGLTRVIPARDRIVVWRACFESSNFTNREIRDALRRQDFDISAKAIRDARREGGRQGLIRRLVRQVPIDKGRLAEDLAEILIARRISQKSEPTRRRRVERCVLTWSERIVQNHLPTGAQIRETNRKTKLLG